MIPKSYDPEIEPIDRKNQLLVWRIEGGVRFLFEILELTAFAICISCSIKLVKLRANSYYSKFKRHVGMIVVTAALMVVVQIFCFYDLGLIQPINYKFLI